MSHEEGRHCGIEMNSSQVVQKKKMKIYNLSSQGIHWNERNSELLSIGR